MKTVLTGFKYIGGEILALEKAGQAHRYMFGFEESCGYLKGTYARDKDAVVASMLVCEMAASLKMQGKTILDAVTDLEKRYGLYIAKVKSVELTGSDAMEKAAKIMLDLRQNAPASIGGIPVTVVRDYKTRIEKNIITGTEKEILLPPSNVLEYILGESGSVIVRPSGTEPKVKYYYTSIGVTASESQSNLDAMITQMS
jgi:phosphoglucomutase